MSLWFSYRDRDGKQKRVSAGIHIPLLLPMLAVVVAMLLPFVHWLRQILR